ncbi:magnesium transporter [archaeon]|nr:magnesium transporter [archaeon]
MSYYRAHRIAFEQLPFAFLTIVIESLAGGILYSVHHQLTQTAYLLFILPPIINLAGEAGCIYAARLSTRLHLGLVAPRIKHAFHLREAGLVTASATVCATALVIVGAPNFIATTPLLILLLAPYTAIYITLVAMILLAGLVSILAFLRGLDPDNVSIPVITTLADLVGASAILLTAFLLLS